MFGHITKNEKERERERGGGNAYIGTELIFLKVSEMR